MNRQTLQAFRKIFIKNVAAAIVRKWRTLYAIARKD